jgi:hypothetical protein
MFDKNFFPTPEEVIKKMLEPYYNESSFEYETSGKLILEPSAGKGDILEELCKYRTKENVYCIEKNPDLQKILTGKGYKLIADDFLEFECEHDFNLIVMNPPFDEGDKHLLKAWEIMNNGDIVCLLNAETIRNPYNKTRQLLATIIKDNGGSVEELGNCFSTAERKTDVEVVLVRLTKKAERKAFDFGTMESENLEFDEDLGSEIATGDTIGNIVLHYEEAKKDFKEALQKMDKMNQSMKFLTGEYGMDVYKEMDSYGSPHNKYHSFLDNVKVQIWNNIIKQLNIEKYMTSKVREDFDRKVREMGNMAINEANIKNVVMAVIQNSGNILEDGIVEVFDIFTKYYKENRVHVEGWKTNDSWKVNRKIILPYVIKAESYNSHYRAEYSAKFSDIEKCLCYISGIQYDHITHLNTWIEQVAIGDSSWHNSRFFEFRCYKKGTIHLKFKDEWLWKEFNMRATKGKNWLPEAEEKAWREERKEYEEKYNLPLLTN